MLYRQCILHIVVFIFFKNTTGACAPDDSLSPTEATHNRSVYVRVVGK